MIVTPVRLARVVAVAGAVVLAACSSSAHTTSPGASSAAPASSSTAPATTPTSTSSASSSTSAAPARVGPVGGPVPKGFTPYSTTFVSSQLGWALGAGPCSAPPCGSIVRTTDGGKTWRGIPAPNANVRAFVDLGDGDVSTLRFADQKNGWAAGRGLYVTHDGGATWRSVSVFSAGSTVTSIGTGGGYVYASVSSCIALKVANCPKMSRIWASKIDSDHWTTVSLGMETLSNPQLAVEGADWFFMASDALYHRHGTSPQTIESNPCTVIGDGHHVVPEIAVADANHLDALCHDGGAGGSTIWQLWGTTNGGNTWAKAGPSHRELSGVYGLADNGHGVLLAAAASAISQIERSTNDGGSFSPAKISVPPGGVTWADLGFTTTTQAVVVLPAHGMYLSHNAGQSWARVAF